jgi:hypothetical protein
VKTFAIRVVATARNGPGKSIGRNGGEISDGLKAIWTTLRRRSSLSGSTLWERALLSEHPLSTEFRTAIPPL